MLKNKLFYTVMVFSCLLLSSCVKDVKDAVDEAALSLQCLERVQDFDAKVDANPDLSCDEIIADLDDIERTCAEYLSDSSKEQLAVLRANCN